MTNQINRNPDCFICGHELQKFNQSHLICYPCKQAYYLNENKEWDYYCHLGELMNVD